MESALAAWLASRQQAPLAGYLLAFAAEYGPRAAPLFALALLLVLGLAHRVMPRAAPEARDADADADADAAAVRRARRRLRLAPLLGFAMALGFQRLVLEPLPHVGDEATYLFEARLIAGGAAAAPAPDPRLVELTGVPFTAVHQGRWLGAFPPGWPLVLAPLVLLGTPFLAGPLLLGLNVALIGAWARRHFGEDLAGWTALLAAVSPCLFPIHASLMADPLCLAALLGMVLALEDGRPGLAGTCTGLAVLARPAALFFVVGAGAAEWRRRRRHHPVTREELGRFLAGGLPALAFLLLWNHAATGAAWTSPYTLAAPATGFLQGGSRYQGLEVRHGPVAALVNLGMNLFALDQDLLGWPGISLLPALLGVSLAGAAGRGGALRGGILGLVLGQAGYFHPGLAYGPRFYLAATPWLLAASVAGLAAWLERRGVAPEVGLPRLWVLALPAVVLGYGAPFLEGYARYAQVDPRPLEHVDRHLPPTGRLLVLVPALGYPDRPLMRVFQARVDPWLARREIYLEDPGDPDQVALLASLTGRTPWRPPSEGAPWSAAGPGPRPAGPARPAP